MHKHNGCKHAYCLPELYDRVKLAASVSATDQVVDDTDAQCAAAVAQFKGDINLSATFSNDRVLHAAVRGCLPQTLAALAARPDINPNIVDGFRWTPLMVATRHGSKRVELLLQAFADRIDLNAVTSLGLSALHMAVRAGSQGVVRLLLEAGANTKLLSGRRQTPLDAAIEEGHMSMAADIVMHNAWDCGDRRLWLLLCAAVSMRAAQPVCTRRHTLPMLLETVISDELRMTCCPVKPDSEQPYRVTTEYVGLVAMFL